MNVLYVLVVNLNLGSGTEFSIKACSEKQWKDLT